MRYAICNIQFLKEVTSMTKMLLIGNLISCVSSVFLMLSTLTNDRRRAYLFQMLESLFLVISSLFFAAPVRLISQAFGVARNYLVMIDKYTVPLMVAFTLLCTGMGVALNTEGWLGVIVIVATIQLSLCNYYCKTVRATKIGFVVNLLMWSVYSFLISDVAYGIANGAISLMGIASLMQYERRQKQTA